MKPAALVLLLLACAIGPTIAAAPSITQESCARAAKYSDTCKGSSVLVMQNGNRTFEHYANGGGVDAAWPIFSGTKSFWGIAALAAVGQGMFRLDDRVSDTITEWKNDPRKANITVRQLL